MADWNRFEQHLRNALRNDVDPDDQTISVLDGWGAFRSSSHTLASLLAKVREMGNGNPYSAIHQMETVNEAELKRIQAAGDYWQEAASHLYHMREGTVKPSLAGKNMAPHKLNDLTHTYNDRVENLADEYVQKAIFKHAVNRYRKHIRETYGLGTPEFNKYHF